VIGRKGEGEKGRKIEKNAISSVIIITIAIF
jgi:hypothetical protein